MMLNAFGRAFGPLVAAFCLLVGLYAAPVEARRDAPAPGAVATPTEAPTGPAGKGATTPLAKVVLNAVVGPPDALGRQLHQELAAALGKRSFQVLRAGDAERPDYVLRTYVLASMETTHSKVAYVLDIVDPTGRRLGRFASEEIVDLSADPWAAISPALGQLVAAKAVGGFEGWLAKQR